MEKSKATSKPENWINTCLGPIAIALQLAFTTDKKYQATWKACFVNAFKLFPGVSDFAELIAGSQFENCTVIRELADICYWGTTRTSNKMYPPLALVYASAMRNALFKAKSQDAYLKLDTGFIEAADVDNVFNTLDFSGAGMYYFWNQLAGTVFQMKKGKLDVRTSSELLFHGTFGTHKEDLSLCHQMTGHEFQTRKDIGDKLQSRGQSFETVDMWDCVM